MPLIRLCRSDPLVSTLYQTFGANPVRVPELRVQPLCVVASLDSKVAFRGALEPLLTGDLAVPDGVRAESAMADLAESKCKSGDIKIDVGLGILENFLSGFGIPAPGIKAHFSEATYVAFAFREVVRDWIDDNWLGRVLGDRAIDQQNKAAIMFLRRPRWELLVIDSVIKSRAFTIHTTKAKSGSFQFDLSAINRLVGEVDAGVSVSSASSTELTFTGSKHLTFAFTTLKFHLDEFGNITSMPPGTSLTPLAYGSAASARAAIPGRVEFSREPAMIEWDEV